MVGRRLATAVYKNIILFKKDRRGRRSLQTLCGIIFLGCRGRRPRRPVCSAQSYIKPLLLGEVDAYADGEVQDTQAPNEIPRSWASHSLAFFRLTRSKKGSTPRRFLPYPLSHQHLAALLRMTCLGGVIFVILIVGRWIAAAVHKNHCVLRGRPVVAPTGLIVVLNYHR